ncbi:RicAFT regulatory complex protein RicA family protein [Lactovum odontotermitis]
MPSNELSKLASSLTKLMRELDYVQAFQKAEVLLREDKALWADYEKMKDLQKEAVLYNKLGKSQAFKETAQTAQKIEKQLKNNLLVQDYSTRMEDVNDLLQYVTGEVERKVNELL